MSTKIIEKPARRKSQKTGKLRSVRRRLSPEARSEMILDNAITFFAEHGFDGQMKDLAEQIGISQALIFSYFGSKQVLIERVYDRVYVSRWKHGWQALLEDRSKPFEVRLVDYYNDYFASIDEPIWIRIALYSGLAGNELTRRYVSDRVERILRTIVNETYENFAFSKRDFPENDLYEIVWDLQASFLYGLIRKHVWRLPVMEDAQRLVQLRVRNFLDAMAARKKGLATPQRPRVKVK